MRISLIRQPIFMAILTMMIIPVVTLWGGDGASVVSQSVGLARWIDLFTFDHPALARWISLFLIIVSGVRIARFIVRFNIFNGRFFIAMPIFSYVMCGIATSPQFLLHYIVGWLASWGFIRLYRSMHTGSDFSRAFWGSAIIGALPLLIPSTVVALVVIPIAMVLFKRSLREFISALFGAAFPLFTYIYVGWLVERIAPLTLAAQLFEGVSFDYHNFIPAVADPRLLFEHFWYVALLVVLAIWATRLVASGFYSMGFRVRTIMLFNLIVGALLPLVLILVGVPSWAIGAIVATPLALAITHIFTRNSEFFGVIVYSILTIAALFNIIFS